jgi:hypothetical protein
MMTINRVIRWRFESSGPYAMRFACYERIKFEAVLSGSFSLRDGGEPEPIRLRGGECYLPTDGRGYRTFNSDNAEEIDGTAFFTASVIRTNG